MTKWEQSCVSAIIAGDTAFSLFKLQQKNIKHLDHFLNKISPYKRKKIKKVKQNGMTFSYVLRKAIEVGKNLNEYASHSFEFDVNMDSAAFFDIMFPLKEISFEETNANNIFVIKVKAKSGYYDANETVFSISGETKLSNSSIEKLQHYYIEKATIQFLSSRIGTGKLLKKLEDVLNDSTVAKKPKKQKSKKGIKYEGLNVGIEIEYSGGNCQKLEKKLLKMGAISFHSGWDGTTRDGDEPGCGRLRENRLRLNGIKFAKPLEYLCNEMERMGCVITLESGMHYHIDGTFKPFLMNSNFSSVTNVEATMMNCMSKKSIKSIFDIFDINENFSNYEKEIMFFAQRIEKKNEFQTFEWRMGTPTLNYSKLIIQILVAIHVTNCMYRLKKADEEYLEFLSEQYKLTCI